MSDSESVEEGKCPGCGEELAPGYSLCQDCEKDQGELGLVDEEEEQPKYYSIEEEIDDDESEPETESESEDESEPESDSEDEDEPQNEVKIVRSSFSLSMKVQPMVMFGASKKTTDIVPLTNKPSPGNK